MLKETQKREKVQVRSKGESKIRPRYQSQKGWRYSIQTHTYTYGEKPVFRFTQKRILEDWSC